MRRATFLVTGVVQGVGFRPYVYRLAQQGGLNGSVRNTSAHVIVDVQGDDDAVDAFAARLPAEAPSLARILDIQRIETTPDPDLSGFVIVPSEIEEGVRTIVPADTATCEDCLRELFDPADRRHRHPFITCTNCGPRFTIIESLPYDRPNTTLSHLPMCRECRAEYDDPADRRFHAQPISCRSCGPRLWYTPATESPTSLDDDACLARAARLLAQNGILAVKGVGGYHLACSALDGEAVRTLRARKGREAKPLAVMVPDLSTARKLCRISECEAAELTSVARPIVLLRRRRNAWPQVAEEVAPGTDELGVMLAYAPVHHLLFAEGAPEVLVMTSGNLSGEPICYTDDDARSRLSGIADAFLGHNRPIAVPCDDSVVRVIDRQVHPLRRSRGYAPLPVMLSPDPPQAASPTAAPGAAAQATEPHRPPVVFAVGGELKATVCLTDGEHAYLSQHLGDMESLASQSALAFAATHLASLYGLEPTGWACDLHPDYHSTRWAQRSHGDLPLVRVQHHHAHAVSLLAEHQAIGQDALVLAFDGTGYGTDQMMWGGEALLLGQDISSFTRMGHLREVRLPGGDAAVAEPWRIALAHLEAAGVEWDTDLACTRAAGEDLGRLRRLISSSFATTPSTSMGRLFDAASSLLGVCQRQGYEAQAAIELERLAWGAASTATTTLDPDAGLPLPIVMSDDAIIDPGPMFRTLVERLRHGRSTADLAWDVHEWVASCVMAWAEHSRDRHQVTTIGLSGGVFANSLLTTLCRRMLSAAGFTVLTHTGVPAGDGGLALGQALVAAARLRSLEMAEAKN